MKTILILFLLLTAGCSTYSKHECESSDWYQQGYTAAREGETLAQGIRFWQTNCTSEHKVEVDQQKFTDGFNKGIEFLCNETQARLLGQSGRSYQGTCPKEKEAEFVKAYESGRMDFLVSRVAELQEDVRKLQTELSYKDSEIMRLRAAAGSCVR